MQKVGFALESVTPLFLSGNNQNAVELRATSIRGQLRYWYRALLGGLGVTRPDQLHELESQVFGREDQGSPLLVRVKDIGWAGGEIKQNRKLDLGYDKTKKETRRPGLTYLLYSTQLGGNDRPYADVGTTFTLEFSCFSKEAERVLKLAACALWCWTHFGGLGTRARRGGGNVQVKGVSDDEKILRNLPPFTLEGINTARDLRSHVESGLKKVRCLVAQLNTLTTKAPSGSVDFPILYLDYADIWIIQSTWSDALGAMEKVGKQFQQFRHKCSPDFPSVLDDYLNAGRSPTLKRPAFGLPLQFRYRSAPDKQAMVETQHFTRRASPLLFRFLKLGNGKISLVLVYFKSSFLPSGEKLKIQSKGAKQKPQLWNLPTAIVQQNLIQQFRDQFGGHLDVGNWL